MMLRDAVLSIGYSRWWPHGTPALSAFWPASSPRSTWNCR